MSGIKYILRNECTSPALITYQNYSNQLWQYQVEFLPGQTRTIWATEGTLSYDLTKTCIKVLSKTPYPSTSTTPSQPSTNPNIDYTNQYLIQVSTMATSNNWEYSVLNYQNATIVGPIDLGFSNNNWFLNYANETLNGWVLQFYNNTTDDKKVYFINKNGSINYLYEANTNSWNNSTNSNKFGTFTDYDNNVFIFSDFSSTYTYNIPSNFNDFYVDNNYDDGNSVGIIVYQQVNSYSQYILFKPSGYQTLFNYNNNDYGVDSIVYYKSNFFGILVYSNNNNQYSFLNIYNSNGVLINSIDIEANSLTSVADIDVDTLNVSTGITGTFDVEQTTTSGSGTGVTMKINITAGNINFVDLYGKGINYSTGDTITIDGSQIGGSSGLDNIVVTVTDLGYFQLNNLDVQFFGNGKLSLLFWSNFDNATPYFIVIYDGISNEFYTTSHNRNALLYFYYDWQFYTDYWDDTSYWYEPSSDFHIQFNDGSGSWNGSLYSVDDCDIISWFDSTKQFSIYEFAKNVNYDYRISQSINNLSSKSLILNSDKDNGYISFEIFQSTGHSSINVITKSVLDSLNINVNQCGDKRITQFDLPSSALLFIHNYNGTQIDTLYFDNNTYDWWTEYNSFYLVDYANQLSYYWNNSINSILPVPFYEDQDDINYYSTTSQINNGQILLWNSGNTSQIITQNTLSVVRTLPIINDYSIRITKNLVGLVTYNNGGKLVVYVYDLNYNLLNTVTTNETNWNNFAPQENRIYLQAVGPNNTYVHYLITANTFKKVVTSNNNSTYRYNDWQ